MRSNANRMDWPGPTRPLCPSCTLRVLPGQPCIIFGDKEIIHEHCELYVHVAAGSPVHYGPPHRFIVAAKDDAIEITTNDGRLVIVPHVANCITVETMNDV